MTWADMVDRALDRMTAADPTLVEFNRNQLATAMRCTPARASFALQQHRTAQGKTHRRYTVVARGYARAAMWLILDGPGTLTERSRRELTMGHGQHIANDAALRVRTDLAKELDPAMIGHPLVQAVLTGMAANIEAATVGAVRTIAAMIGVWESQSGETADQRGVVTV